MTRRITSFIAITLLAAACADSPTQPQAEMFSAPSYSLADETGTAGNYLVRFRGNAIPAGFEAKVAALGGEVIFAHARAGIAAVAGFSPDAALELGALSGVAAVDADAYTVLDDAVEEAVQGEFTPDGPLTPGSAFFRGRQWNLRAINMQSAWTAGRFGSSTVRVGILDTGIDYLHPDLWGRVNLTLSRSFLSAAENARVPAGAHLVADLNYHGTHVAATVASNALAAAGVTSQIELVGLKVCAPGTPANGFRGTCPTSGTLAAILYAADNGIPIINMSLGGSFLRRNASAAGGFGPSFLATINQVMTYAHRNGTLVVVSAGNSALDIDHDGNGYKSYCSAPLVVCVSATGPTAATLLPASATPGNPGREYVNIQNIDALAFYSNYGRSGITVAAPGGNAIPVWAACSGFTLHPSLAPCRGRFYNPTTGAWSGSVVGLSGTSMAAPHTSGVLALLASRGVSGPAQLRAALQQTADDLGQPGTDPAYGHGRVNGGNAAN